MEPPQLSAPEFASILHRARQGDGPAWEILVTTYRVWVYRMAYRVTRHEDDAYDATQETFMKVATRLHQLDRPEQFPSWLGSIAIREALTICRKRNRIPQPFDPTDLSAALENQPGPDSSPSPRDQAIRNQNIARLDAAAAQLSPQQRAIILMNSINDLTPAEIAAHLDLPANQVRSQLSRAIAKLKTLLNPEQGADHDPAS